jgi:hypothetical protein
MLLHHSRKLCLILCGTALVTIGKPAAACGPFFPNQLLIQPDESALWAPVADFDVELRDIVRPGSGEFRAVVSSIERYDEYAHSTAVDLADLKASLADHGIGGLEMQRVLIAYQQTRVIVEARLRDRAKEANPPASRPAAAVPVELPGDVPAEFASYLRGLLAWSNRQPEAARAAWQVVLALPDAQRRHRTVWASYMLSRSYLDSDPAAAAHWFQQTRALVKQGFPDSLGLASESLGWEALAEWKQGHYASGMDLYVRQAACGDTTASSSLLFLCDEILKNHLEEFPKLAADPSCARVLTATFLSDGGIARPRPLHVQEWLGVLEKANAAGIVGADRLAWAAYQAGDFAMARRWAGRGPKNSGITLWILAKLALRDGKFDDAAALLAQASRAFPDNEEWGSGGGYNFQENVRPASRAAGELGILRLSRRQYADALDRLVKGGWWLDAAYVAERVLTTDELLEYCMKHDPPGGPAHSAARDSEAAMHQPHADRDHPDCAELLRELLARRLTRTGRWKESRPFFPIELQLKLDQYVQAIQRGHDAKLAPIEKGRSFWVAARIAREDGIRLLATELSPDGADFDGAFAGENVAAERGLHDHNHPSTLLIASRDELDRAAAAAPDPDIRWHYRYIAADHAWAAAELLPDETDELAQVLYQAGSWIAARDPKEADRFYRALVRRCRSTTLGKSAKAHKWFPPPTDPAVTPLPR